MDELKKLLENAGIEEAYATSPGFSGSSGSSGISPQQITKTVEGMMSQLQSQASEILMAAFKQDGQIGIRSIETDITKMSIDDHGHIMLTFRDTQVDSEEVGVEELDELRVRITPTAILGMW